MSSGRDEMMSRWDEEKRMKDIENVSAELDDYFVILANKYELSVSALNGILLARLLRLNVETKNEENLYKLLEVVMRKEHESWDRSVH
jgi:uncharacterized membrane protein affecting hemolysin expression